MIPSVSTLVERNMTGSRLLSTRPKPLCPDHRCELEGGHVQYRCPRGHRVQAADLNREVTR
ncbi:hypothetical protein [Actinomadura decatromicini]|uniref:Transposase n=1 Tax=Actinomadura decatromicini TaxID=2604572 RepID=A0A5D3F7X4_9ACTN|nr:hypothetical protein [Actinomadura decatromicini]TYK45117.1 hypothetical protein FXF68_31020 [Actinomadura decatromicini]